MIDAQIRWLLNDWNFLAIHSVSCNQEIWTAKLGMQFFNGPILTNEEGDRTCNCRIVMKFSMSIGSSECMKSVKYFDAMAAFARARKYLRSRPCYKIGNAKILKMLGF